MGASLARIEAKIALVSLCRRLQSSRLLQDPPPYRPGESLRGPEQLGVSITGVGD